MLIMANSKMKRSRTNSLQDEAAITKCYSKIIKCLLKYECNIEEQLTKTDFNQLLHIAIKKRFQSVVKALVKNGADIYFRDNDGNTSLTLAKKYATDQIYDSLVHTEVDINILNSKDSTFFLKISVILLLLESFYANYFPTLYCTYQLIRENPIDMALLLLNSNMIIKDFFLDVYDAVEKGYKDIINIILESGIDINVRDKFGRLMLQCACYQGNESVVQFLLDIGADVNKLDAYQRSPLHTAIVAQQIKIVKLLIKNGANVNARKCGRNLLYSAIDGQHPRGLELVKILVNKGVDINDGLKTSLPLLHYAVEEDCIEIVEFLLKKGANLNNRNMQGETCLHSCIIALKRKGDHHVEVEQYYDLFTSCLINKRNWSIRWHRRVNEKEKMALILLKYGADVNAMDNDGRTPLTVSNIGTIGIVLLIKHIAKLKISNTHVSEMNLKFISDNKKQKVFFVKCEEELKLMKNVIISGNISFYDVLSEKNVNKLAIYAKNEMMKQIIIDSEYGKARFPIYDQELKILFSQGKERRFLLDLAATTFNKYFHFQIPTLVVEKIMLYLSYEDWINLIKS